MTEPSLPVQLGSALVMVHHLNPEGSVSYEKACLAQTQTPQRNDTARAKWTSRNVCGFIFSPNCFPCYLQRIGLLRALETRLEAPGALHSFVYIGPRVSLRPRLGAAAGPGSSARVQGTSSSSCGSGPCRSGLQGATGSTVLKACPSHLTQPTLTRPLHCLVRNFIHLAWHRVPFANASSQAVSRLTTIFELLRSFTADYVRQTNLLLGEPTVEGGQGDLLSSFETAAQQLIMPIPDLAPPVEEKKERKKRTHDPNAPKRPLTPYFLYMQHARSIIANDLGAEAPKGAVQEEGQRRWAHMSPHEKKVRLPCNSS